MIISKRYSWLLLLTLLGTGVAAWLDGPEGNTHSPQIEKQPNSAAKAYQAQASSTGQPSLTESQTLFRPKLAVPLRDIFQTAPLPAPPAPLPAVMPQGPELLPPPPLNVRFLGSFTDPTGKQTLYLAQGETDIEAKVGDTLSSGYLITEADSQAIHMEHPPSGTKVVVPVSDQ